MFINDKTMQSIKSYIANINNGVIAGYHMSNNDCYKALEAARYIVKHKNFDLVEFGADKYQIDECAVMEHLSTTEMRMDFEDNSNALSQDVHLLIADGHLLIAESLSNALLTHAVFDKCIDMIIDGDYPAYSV